MLFEDKNWGVVILEEVIETKNSDKNISTKVISVIEFSRNLSEFEKNHKISGGEGHADTTIHLMN